MSVFFGATHRQLQDEHGTRKLADRLEEHAHAAFEPPERMFIESVAMFFLVRRQMIWDILRISGAEALVHLG